MDAPHVNVGLTPAEIEARLRAILAARQADRREETDQYLDDDIIVETVGPTALKPYCGRLVGKDALRDFRRAFIVEVERISSDVLDLMVDGDRALVRRRLVLRNRGGGGAIELDVWERYRFRNGKVVEIIQQTDTVALARLVGRSDLLAGARE